MYNLTKIVELNKNAKIIKMGSFFYFYKVDGLWWFRFFHGYGLAGKDLRKRQLLYSERSGNTLRFQVGNWSFKFLKRD